MIVLRLDERHHLPNDAQLLGHELGHVAFVHTHRALIAASGDEREQREREADDFARQYAVWS